MIRKFLGFLSILIFAAAATSAGQVAVDDEPVKIGYMNVQEVISQMPERPAVERQLNDFIAEKRNQLQQRTASFQQAVADYQENRASMSQQQQDQREEELAQMEEELVNYQQTLQAEMQQKRTELLSPLYDRINAAIETVAQELELDFVLNEETGIGEKIVYFSSTEKLNITQRVLERVTNQSTQN